MQVNIVCSLFILDSEQNENIRKNANPYLKVLLNKNGMLPSLEFNCGEIEKLIRNYIKDLIHSNIFYLKQVYTKNYEKSIDIIYVAITNIVNIKKLHIDYELKKVEISEDFITLDKNKYNYKEDLQEQGYELDIKDRKVKRTIQNLLISYYYVKKNLDDTDIIFNFMKQYFTLEEVRLAYELIKNKNVDKSNFRKRIIKYCEKSNINTNSKNGFRPSQMYKLK